MHHFRGGVANAKIAAVRRPACIPIPGFFLAGKTAPQRFFQSAMKEPSKGIGKGGRPPHRPSDMDRRIVELAASYAVPTINIVELLGISQKTLFKHYRRELDVGAARLEAALALRLYAIAGGKGAIALRAAIFLLRSRFGWSRYLPRPL